LRRLRRVLKSRRRPALNVRSRPSSGTKSRHGGRPVTGPEGDIRQSSETDRPI
jgi:hypothetical protein